MRHLSLFTGGGGVEYGAKLLGWTTVGYVEWDEYCCKVVAQRIKDGIFDDAPVFVGDIRAFIHRGYAGAYQGMVDVVSGGPPCQGFSEAGKGLGEQDSRNMVPAMLDVVEIVKPTFVWLENVPSRKFREYYLAYIEPRLRKMGYCSAYGIVSAEDAIWLNCYPELPAIYHERKRTWIIAVASADPDCVGGYEGIHRTVKETQEGRRLELLGEEIADPNGYKCKRQPIYLRPGRQESSASDTGGTHGKGWWSIEPGLGRLVYGMADRRKRIKAAGNGQVPAVVKTAWHLLTSDDKKGGNE